MALSLRSIKYLSRTLKRLSVGNNDIYIKIPFVEKRVFLFSTATCKYIDVFELFTDILHFNRLRHNDQKPAPIVTVAVTTDCIEVNDLRQKLRTLDDYNTAKILKYELENNVRHHNWKNVTKIMNLLLEKQVNMENSEIILLAKTFTKIGLKDGLNLLRSLCSLTNPEMFVKEGEFLHYLAKCNWVCGNVKGCLAVLHECLQKYPALKDICKELLKGIIFEAVSSRSEAELLNVINFIKKYTYENNDYYPIAVLWNCLFLSEWFTDQIMANTLVETVHELQLCINLMSSSIIKYLISSNRINDVYRLLQVLLKYKMMDACSVSHQMMFDHYCAKRDRYSCSEIVKASVTLNAPLREEQYNQFISWSVSGDPFKFIKKAEIEKIYSTF